MKRYPASVARERMADVLDEVERSGAALIERGDVRYVITRQRRPSRPRTVRGTIEVLDPAVAAGEWHWDWTAGGARFAGSRRKRR
jgi:hypothetical protein